MNATAFLDELQKIAASVDEELAPHIEKARRLRHPTADVDKGMQAGFYTGGLGGGLGGAAYGGLTGKSPLGRIWRGGTRGVGGLLLGSLVGMGAGAGVGSLISKIRGKKGLPYTPQEARMRGISDYLRTYQPPEGTYEWRKPQGLTPEQLKKHRAILALENEFIKAKGISPY